MLASFYWAYIVSQVVGGLATQKLGTKKVFGYAQLATALSSLCIPIAAETHYGLVIALRSIQGFASVSFWFFFLNLFLPNGVTVKGCLRCCFKPIHIQLKTCLEYHKSHESLK